MNKQEAERFVEKLDLTSDHPYILTSTCFSVILTENLRFRTLEQDINYGNTVPPLAALEDLNQHLLNMEKELEALRYFIREKINEEGGLA